MGVNGIFPFCAMKRRIGRWIWRDRCRRGLAKYFARGHATCLFLSYITCARVAATWCMTMCLSNSTFIIFHSYTMRARFAAIRCMTQFLAYVCHISVIHRVGAGRGHMVNEIISVISLHP